MERGVPRTDVLITLMGSPHGSDLITSVLRLVQAVLDRGGTVQVWACGYATLLTQRSLGDSKPRNLAAWSTGYPSTVALVEEMLRASRGRLHWYGCRFCSDDRGARDHIDGVGLRAPAQFADNIKAAGKTVFVGVL